MFFWYPHKIFQILHCTGPAIQTSGGKIVWNAKRPDDSILRIWTLFLIRRKTVLHNNIARLSRFERLDFIQDSGDSFCSPLIIVIQVIPIMNYDHDADSSVENETVSEQETAYNSYPRDRNESRHAALKTPRAWANVKRVGRVHYPTTTVEIVTSANFARTPVDRAYIQDDRKSV